MKASAVRHLFFGIASLFTISASAFADQFCGQELGNGVLPDGTVWAAGLSSTPVLGEVLVKVQAQASAIGITQSVEYFGCANGVLVPQMSTRGPYTWDRLLQPLDTNDTGYTAGADDINATEGLPYKVSTHDMWGIAHFYTGTSIWAIGGKGYTTVKTDSGQRTYVHGFVYLENLDTNMVDVSGYTAVAIDFP